MININVYRTLFVAFADQSKPTYVKTVSETLYFATPFSNILSFEDIYDKVNE